MDNVASPSKSRVLKVREIFDDIETEKQFERLDEFFEVGEREALIEFMSEFYDLRDKIIVAIVENANQYPEVYCPSEDSLDDISDEIISSGKTEIDKVLNQTTCVNLGEQYEDAETMAITIWFEDEFSARFRESIYDVLWRFGGTSE